MTSILEKLLNAGIFSYKNGFHAKIIKLLLTLAGGVWVNHIVLICHIMTFFGIFDRE